MSAFLTLMSAQKWDFRDKFQKPSHFCDFGHFKSGIAYLGVYLGFC